MCTKEIKFYNGERIKEGLKKYYPKELSETNVWSLFSATTDEKLWGLEFEKKFSLPPGTIKLKSLLENTDEKHADILYDFKGDNIFMKRFNIYDTNNPIKIKIEEDTFTRLFPLYSCCLPYDDIEFEIEGDITFKIGILTNEFRRVAAKGTFDSPVNDQYFLRYSCGISALRKMEERPKLLEYRKKEEFLNFKNLIYLS